MRLDVREAYAEVEADVLRGLHDEADAATEDAVRLPARERFRFYRERGYALENHNVADGF